MKEKNICGKNIFTKNIFAKNIFAKNISTKNIFSLQPLTVHHLYTTPTPSYPLFEVEGGGTNELTDRTHAMVNGNISTDVTEPRRPHDTAQLHNPEEMPQIKQGRANCKSDCRNFAWSEVAFDRISSVGSPRHLCQLQASQWRWWESCDLSC